jgi:glycosyltransferase involved in cell wall biosynthesis
MKNQKNLISVMHIIPSLKTGGAEKQLTLLAIQQINKGYDVNIVIRKKGFFYQKLKGKAKIHIVGDYKFLDFRLLLKLLKLIKLCKPNIIQTWLPQMNVVGGVACLITNKPWVATERTGKKYYQDKFRLINFFQEKIMPFSSVLVTNSKNGFLFWKNKILKKNLFLVNNAIDFGLINKFKKKKYLMEKFKLISVGRFEKSKGFNTVVRAIKEISPSVNINLKIIGYGNQKNEIIDLIRKLNLHRKIKVITDGKNWHKSLRDTVALISMSKFEGQPNVLLEAAAGNCPLIISDIPEHKEIFDKKSAIFVPLDNFKKLSEAILFLIHKPGYAQKMAKAAQLKINHMTIESQFTAYDKIYKNLLKI